MVIKSSKLLAAVAAFGLVLFVVTAVISGLKAEKHFEMPFIIFLTIASVPYLATLIWDLGKIKTLEVIFYLTILALLFSPHMILEKAHQPQLPKYAALVFGCLFIAGLFGWATRALYDNFREYLEKLERQRKEETRKKFPWANGHSEDE